MFPKYTTSPQRDTVRSFGKAMTGKIISVNPLPDKSPKSFVVVVTNEQGANMIYNEVTCVKGMVGMNSNNLAPGSRVYVGFEGPNRTDLKIIDGYNAKNWIDVIQAFFGFTRKEVTSPGEGVVPIDPTLSGTPDMQQMHSVSTQYGQAMADAMSTTGDVIGGLNV